MHADKRQTHHLGFTKDELDEAINGIIDFYEIEWLENDKEEHPLQQLWKRKDYLATNELMILGIVLNGLKRKNVTWLKNLVKKSKSIDRNTRIGAFFEMFGLGYFQEKNYTILPAAINQKGFDGIIQFSNGAAIRLSLKNYGESVHNSEFESKCKDLDLEIKQILRRVNSPPIVILIDFSESYPGKNQWKDLSSSIARIIRKFDGEIYHEKLKSGWNVYLSNLNLYPDIAHPISKSYTLIVVCDYHKNEKKNLIDKLDEGFYNLKNHSNIQDNSIINFVYVHLPMTASMQACTEWATMYLTTNSKLISGVIFYQPTVTTDLQSNTINISHYVEIIYTKDFIKWMEGHGLSVSDIEINFPVGVVTRAPSDLLFKIGNDHLKIANKYIFQTGEHYITAIVKKDGTIEGSLRKEATGITKHLVMKPIPNDQEIIFTSHEPKELRLLII